jgi:hypothetical protein
LQIATVERALPLPASCYKSLVSPPPALQRGSRVLSKALDVRVTARKLRIAPDMSACHLALPGCTGQDERFVLEA